MEDGCLFAYILQIMTILCKVYDDDSVDAVGRETLKRKLIIYLCRLVLDCCSSCNASL